MGDGGVVSFEDFCSKARAFAGSKGIDLPDPSFAELGSFLALLPERRPKVGLGISDSGNGVALISTDEGGDGSSTSIVLEFLGGGKVLATFYVPGGGGVMTEIDAELISAFLTDFVPRYVWSSPAVLQ